MKMVKVVVGLMGSSANAGSTKMNGSTQLEPLLKILQTHQIHELDTARAYNSGRNEEDLGAIPWARSTFSIATKAPGFSPGSLAYERVKRKCAESLAALRQEKIDLYYIHGPDPTTPLEDSLRAMDELYREGKFTTLGISNYSAAQVEQIQALCAEKGWVRPSVYQGMYNGLWRTPETALFPVLKRFGMAFYAFSPLAGGFFSKSTAELRDPPKGGRMEQMSHFKNMYVNEISIELHDRLSAVCGEAGCSLKEAELRWLMHHSGLGEADAIVLGGSSAEQLEENLMACEAGPLPEKVAQCFEEIWEEYKKSGKLPNMP